VKKVASPTAEGIHEIKVTGEKKKKHRWPQPIKKRKSSINNTRGGGIRFL